MVEHGGRKTAQVVVAGPAEHAFETAMARLQKRTYQIGLLYTNSLISLVSSAEWFLSQILHKYFEVHPDAAGIRDRTLTLSDLQAIGSIQEARDYLLDLRIEEVLRGSFSDWVAFLKAPPVKLSMSYLADHESKLIGACQRRNLFVHNGGVVNNIYMKKVPE